MAFVRDTTHRLDGRDRGYLGELALVEFCAGPAVGILLIRRKGNEHSGIRRLWKVFMGNRFAILQHINPSRSDHQ